MLPDSSQEMVRRSNIFFKDLDRLEHLTFLLLSDRSSYSRHNSSRAGNLLLKLREHAVRKICGEVIYRAGIKELAQGKISEARFGGDKLSGRITDTKNLSKVFEPNITLQRISRSVRLFGECSCILAREGTLCPHMASLMIQWVRDRKPFVEDPDYLKSQFEAAKKQAVESLQAFVLALEEEQNIPQVKATLQKSYSKMRRWLEQANSAAEVLHPMKRKEFNPVREFSQTVNQVSLLIISQVEQKYSLRGTEAYNKATLSAFGKVLELFAEGSNVGALPEKERGIENSRRTARSWDSLIETFAGS